MGGHCPIEGFSLMAGGKVVASRSGRQGVELEKELLGSAQPCRAACKFDVSLVCFPLSFITYSCSVPAPASIPGLKCTTQASSTPPYYHPSWFRSILIKRLICNVHNSSCKKKIVGGFSKAAWPFFTFNLTHRLVLKQWRFFHGGRLGS